jgi:hypothetical protein
MMMVKENQVYMRDKWYGMYGATKRVFYSFEQGNDFMSDFFTGELSMRGNYFSMYFLENEKTEAISRSVITIWDILADIGGIIEILFVSMGLLVAGQAHFQYESALV